jgi:hypothetical protein
MRRNNIVTLMPDEAKKLVAKTVRAKLFEKCRAGAEHAGVDIAGFALVVWDRHGDLWSSYDARIGMIGPALVPTLAHDSLNRHVAVMLAAERSESEGTA